MDRVEKGTLGTVFWGECDVTIRTGCPDEVQNNGARMIAKIGAMLAGGPRPVFFDSVINGSIVSSSLIATIVSKGRSNYGDFAFRFVRAGYA